MWIEKSVTRNHCSSSLGKPRDADQWPSWQIFLSAPYTLALATSFLYWQQDFFIFFDKYFSFQWLKWTGKQWGRRLTADHTFVTSPNFNDVTKIGWETSSATSRARRERLSFVLFLSSGRKNSQEIVFSVYFSGAPILRPDKHAELLKINF